MPIVGITGQRQKLQMNLDMTLCWKRIAKSLLLRMRLSLSLFLSLSLSLSLSFSLCNTQSVARRTVSPVEALSTWARGNQSMNNIIRGIKTRKQLQT
jgi:hypothetical protein